MSHLQHHALLSSGAWASAVLQHWFAALSNGFRQPACGNGPWIYPFPMLLADEATAVPGFARLLLQHHPDHHLLWPAHAGWA